VPKDWNDRLQIHDRFKRKVLTMEQQIGASQHEIKPKQHDQALER
jgi:hypothetical protein